MFLFCFTGVSYFSKITILGEGFLLTGRVFLFVFPVIILELLLLLWFFGDLFILWPIIISGKWIGFMGDNLCLVISSNTLSSIFVDCILLSVVFFINILLLLNFYVD